MEHYLNIRKNDFLSGATFILCVAGLFIPYISWGALIVSSVLFLWAILWNKANLKLCFFDILVSLAFFYEIILCFTTINKGPAVSYLMMAFYGLFVYFTCRLCLSSLRIFWKILLWMSVVECIVLVIGLASWFQFRREVHCSGFDSLYELRSLFTPWGNTLNLWATFLVAFLGNIIVTYLYYRTDKKVLIFLNFVFALLIWSSMATFSRTVYLLLIFVFLLLLTGGLFLNRKHGFLWLILSYIVTVVSFCAINGAEDIGRVLQFNGSVSQQRSTAARVNVLTSMSDAMAGDMAFGAGNGNWSLAFNDILFEADDITFTNFASSGYIQLITEKGVVGASLWGIILSILCVGLVIAFLRHRRWDCFFVLSSIILLMVKEMTFAVFEDFPNLQGLFIIPVVGLTNLQKINYPGLSFIKSRNYFPVIAGLFAVFCGVRLLQKAELLPKRCDTSDLINRSSACWEKYLESNRASDLEQATAYMSQALESNRRDNMLKYNLAMLYLSGNKLAEASNILTSLVQKYPENALYRTGLAKEKYCEGSYNSSAREYAQALIFDPRITDDPEWEELKQTNAHFFSLIEKEIYKTVKDGKTNDPIRLAKLGKIFLELGDLSAAEAYLEKALSMLPNLGRAWYNLGITTLLQGRESETKRCILKAKLFDASDASICLYLENGESNLLLTKEGDYFLKVRTKEYYKKIHTWYRQKPEGQLIMVENIF